MKTRTLPALLSRLALLLPALAGCAPSGPTPPSSTAPVRAVSAPAQPEPPSGWGPPLAQAKTDFQDIFRAHAKPPACTVIYYRDRSESTLAPRDTETLYWEECADNFCQMAQTLPEGSRLEVYASGTQPGIPTALLSYQVPVRAPRQAKTLYRARREQEANALQAEIVRRGVAATAKPILTASWIAEDIATLSARAPGVTGALVVATDGEQNSNLVCEAEIPPAPNLTPLVSRILTKCPLTQAPPAQLTLVQLRHSNASGSDYTADALKYARFLELCAQGWKIGRFVRVEPRALARGL